MPYYEFTGKTVKEAIEKACLELNVEEALLDVNVLEESTKGFLGIVGHREARIKVRKRDILKEVMEAEESAGPTTDESGTPAETAVETKHLSVEGERTPKPAEEKARPSAEASSALEHATNVLEEILKRMPMETEVKPQMVDGKACLDIKGDGSGLLIGKKGQTLDALQFLVSKIVNRDKPVGNKIKIEVDTENYRLRRRESLREKALKMSGRAKRTLKPVWADPMPPNERRILHMMLAEDREVFTKSHGDGPMRRLVVYPLRGTKNKRRGR